jgi:putative acetyltransferase
MIEIRGQQATDWQDVYAIRVLSPGGLPYIRPDWVKNELAQVPDRSWPLVAVAHLAEGEKTVARANIELGAGRRVHSADLSLEQHPELGQEAGRQLLGKAVEVAEKWLNRSRLAVRLPSTDESAIALYSSFGFVQEARLRQAVRLCGRLVDELLMARLTGAADQKAASWPPEGVIPVRSPGNQSHRPVYIRGGSAEDWEAYHRIWSQPSVYWGTLGIPFRSADVDRRRVQERPPERSWPLVAELDGRVVGNTGIHLDEHHRSHVGHIGMSVDEAYQGMGVGSALMAAVLDLADNWLGLRRLQLEVYADNDRAIRLYRKGGFETEGTMRSYVFRDGRFVDTLVMGRLVGQAAPGGRQKAADGEWGGGF